VIIKRGIFHLVPLIALVGLLAGCAAPVPSPTSPPTHSPAAPTATPTPVAAGAPGSRVPLGCAGLLGASTLTAITGKAPHVYHDQNTAPTNIADIAQDQYGALDCNWFQQDNTITGAELQVDVAPDAQSAFTSRFAAIMADQSLSTHPTATENIAGDQSGFWCANVVDALGADSNLPICDGELLVSGYWVSIEVDTVNGLSRSQLVAAVPTVMKDIATRIEAAGSGPAQWVAPATTPPGFCTASTSTAIVRSIFGDSTLVAATTPSNRTTASTIGLVGPYAACNWRSKSDGYLQIRLLAGGSWAFPSFAPLPTGDSSFTAQDYSALTVAGTTSVKEACLSGTCDAFLAVGSSAVEVTYNDPGVAKRPSVLSAFATALAAS
jgi:hypothetical protein